MSGMSSSLLINVPDLTILRGMGMNPTQEEFDNATAFLDDYAEDMRFAFRRHSSSLANTMFLRSIYRANHDDATEEEIATHVCSEVTILEEELLVYTPIQVTGILYEIFQKAEWLMRLSMPYDFDTFLARVYTRYLYLHSGTALYSDMDEWPCLRYQRRRERALEGKLRQYDVDEEEWFKLVVPFGEVDWNSDDITIASMEEQRGKVGPMNEPW